MSLNSTRMLTAPVYVPVTKSGTELTLADGRECYALFVGTAGTANLTQPDGTDRADFPLQAGVNPVSVLKVRTGGTASDIWAMYPPKG